MPAALGGTEAVAIRAQYDDGNNKRRVAKLQFHSRISNKKFISHRIDFFQVALLLLWITIVDGKSSVCSNLKKSLAYSPAKPRKVRQHQRNNGNSKGAGYQCFRYFRYLLIQDISCPLLDSHIKLLASQVARRAAGSTLE